MRRVYGFLHSSLWSCSAVYHLLRGCLLMVERPTWFMSRVRTLVSASLLSGGTFGPMDYDELSGEVYVPDEKHNALDVLTPIDPGQAGMARLPKKPNRIIRTGAAPIAVAITNDGLLGFVALQGGSVAMFDLIGRHLVYAVLVEGAPHFIITGPYPPSIVSTPLNVTKPQETVEGGRVNVVFYVFGAVLVVLILLVFLLWRLRRQRFYEIGFSAGGLMSWFLDCQR
jgi:hypothetical protein